MHTFVCFCRKNKVLKLVHSSWVTKYTSNLPEKWSNEVSSNIVTIRPLKRNLFD